MGKRVLARLAGRSDVALAAVLDRHTDGLDLPDGVRVGVAASDVLAAVDVAVDFTAPPACADTLPVCAERGIAYVLASTGLEAAHQAAVDAAAARIPMVVASNFSVGVNLLAQLAELAASRLGAAADVEISEIHHKHKRDAPSGTALSLGAAVKRGRRGLVDHLGRAGAHVRAPEELGYAALRGGDVSGEHTVYFFADGERIELTHRATTPDIFADGALRAAAWVVGKAPGVYGMSDVLG